MNHYHEYKAIKEQCFITEEYTNSQYCISWLQPKTDSNRSHLPSTIYSYSKRYQFKMKPIPHSDQSSAPMTDAAMNGIKEYFLQPQLEPQIQPFSYGVAGASNPSIQVKPPAAPLYSQWHCESIRINCR